MDQHEGMRFLGLGPGAGADEVKRAYRSRCLALKTQILCAHRALLKDQYREELRALVTAREAALGRAPRRDWAGQRLGLSGGRLVRKLGRTSTDHLDDRGARAFFGLAPHAGNAQVLDAYLLRKRALIRSFANSHDDDEMADIRRARMKLRTLRNFALASP
ncbi:MAG: hypothetical protein ACYTEZ_07730 [Planctomycetota bacterium]|jgi:hypothetical protein